MTLDEGDNDAVVLWSHVIEALGRACPELAEAMPAELVAAAPLLEVVLPRLVNALAEQGELVLILDDFHRLDYRSEHTLTEVREFEGPHLLPAQEGWEEVADSALEWALDHTRTGAPQSAA